MIHNNSNRRKIAINPKISIVFIVLIILQLYSLPFISSALSINFNQYASYMYFYAMSTYTIIVIGIIVFHFSGIDLFSDHFTLWIIVLSCFLRTTFGESYGVYYQLYMLFLGIALSAYIIANRKNFKIPGLKSVFIGILWSIGTVVIIGLIHISLDQRRGSLPSDLLTYIFNLFSFQLSYVTVIEEACFRGLLFGFLMMNGCKENKALFIQAILFWGIHYMKLADPILVFIIIPILTISVTLLMKRYKMLYLPIMVHTINNVFGGILIALL